MSGRNVYKTRIDKIINNINEKISKHGLILSWTSAANDLKEPTMKGNSFFVIWLTRVSTNHKVIVTSGPGYRIDLEEYTLDDLFQLLIHS